MRLSLHFSLMALVLTLAMGLYPQQAFSTSASELQEVVRRVLIARVGNIPLDLSEVLALESQFVDLKSSPRPDHNKYQPLARQIARRYLLSGHLQEAMWILSRAGLETEVRFIESQLKRIFQAGTSLPPDALQDRGNAAWWTFPNGIQALAKIPEIDWPRSMEYEEFTYRLDRLLGINRVPFTVVYRGVNRDFSLQLRVLGAEVSDENLKQNRYLYTKTEGLVDAYVLDYLSGQTDRHESNSMYTRSGRLVLIDNGRAFGSFQFLTEIVPTPEEYFELGGVIDQSLMNQVEAISYDELKSTFSSILTEEEIEVLFKRFENLKRVFGSKPAARLGEENKSTGFLQVCRELLKPRKGIK